MEAGYLSRIGWANWVGHVVEIPERDSRLLLEPANG